MLELPQGAPPALAHNSALSLWQGLKTQNPRQAEFMYSGILRHTEAFHIAVSLNKRYHLLSAYYVPGRIRTLHIIISFQTTLEGR